MDIRLDLIQPSANPIRKTWAEDKMNELAQSIAEQGVIVPIKVREMGDGYEIVYGHRRVEACRRAGVDSIPTIVEGMQIDEALIQALIENLVREDMDPLDIAQGLLTLKEVTGWSNREIARRGFMHRTSVHEYLELLDEEPDVQEMVVDREEWLSNRSTPEVDDDRPLAAPRLTTRHVVLTRRVGLPDEDRAKVLRKGASEELSANQTRNIAEAVRAAPTPQVKQRLIETRYNPIIHDAETVKEAAKYPDRPRESVTGFEWDSRPEVKAIFDAIKVLEQRCEDIGESIPEWKRTADIGKFAPEAIPFFITRLRRASGKLHTTARRLEELGEWINRDYD